MATCNETSSKLVSDVDGTGKLYVIPATIIPGIDNRSILGTVHRLAFSKSGYDVVERWAIYIAMVGKSSVCKIFPVGTKSTLIPYMYMNLAHISNVCTQVRLNVNSVTQLP